MVTLEEIIPKNHLIRKIDKAIDLNIIHERVAHLYCPDKETVKEFCRCKIITRSLLCK